MKAAIVGAGPAGLFCAYEMARGGIEVTVFDRGSSVDRRFCPDKDCTSCPFIDNCSILCGEGGAGGYSDGKVTLSTTRGVQASNVLDFKRFENEIHDVEQICLKFGPESQYFEPVKRPDFLEGSKFQFESYPLRFYGTTGIRELMHNLRIETQEKYGVQFCFNTEVDEVYYLNEETPTTIISGIEGGTRTSDFFDFTVLANGSYDKHFMRSLARTNGISLSEKGPAGFGIRLETDSNVLEPMMAAFYDFKLFTEHPFQGGTVQYRSFCVNRGGKIVNECRPQSLVSINGRSEWRDTGRSNLAIMSRIGNGKLMVRELAESIDVMGLGLPIYQSALNFVRYNSERETEWSSIPHKLPRRNANKGNIARLLPPELFQGFREYLLELEKIMPGSVTSDSSIIYAPEIKYHMPRWPLAEGFTIENIPLLQVIGNAAGYTDSISTAAVMGLVAARYRLGKL